MEDLHQLNKLDELINKYKVPLAVSLVGLVLLLGGIFSSGILSKTFVKQTKYPKKSLVQPSMSVFKVDVSGAVINPGIYTLSVNARVEEAIKLAGGVKNDADQTYISKSINLAQKISDGMKIYIPFKGDPVPSGAGGISGASTISGSEIINLNSAFLDQLDKLPGIGPVSAQKIIDNRPYSSIEELYTKKVVTKSVYEKIKDRVSVY